MTVKTLEIKTATIEIKVIRVDAHKMTKATFRQIVNDTKTRITFADVLGFVWDNYEVFLLWNDNGSPVKRRIGSYVNKTFDLDGRTVHEPSTFLGCKRMEALCQEVANNCDQLFIAT